MQTYKFSCSEGQAIPNGWNSFQNLKCNTWQVVGLQAGCDNCYCHWMLQGLCRLRFFFWLIHVCRTRIATRKIFPKQLTCHESAKLASTVNAWGHHEAHPGRMYLYVITWLVHGFACCNQKLAQQPPSERSCNCQSISSKDACSNL